DAEFSEDARNVEIELVRGGVLAGIIAAAAIVTEVRQLDEIAVGEGAVQRDGGKDGAITLAIAAGVADLDLPTCFGQERRARIGGRGRSGQGHGGFTGHGLRPPCLQCVRKRYRWSCRTRQDSPGRGLTRP